MFRAIPIIAISLVSGCSSQNYRDCLNDRAGWEAPADRTIALVVIPNVVRIQSDGTLLWNGSRITAQSLSSRLSAARKLQPTPQTILSADGDATCKAVERVRDEFEKRLGCEDGKCAEAAIGK